MMRKLVLGALAVTSLGCGASPSQSVASASSALPNPQLGNAVAIAAGCQLYGAHCAHCHGVTGVGDGEHSADLTPQPASLVSAEALAKPDGHLFQRVWFGGQAPPYNSGMPAFSEVLTHDQVWQTLAYVRALGSGTDVTCADAEAEHSHGPTVAAGTGAPAASAGTATPPSAPSVASAGVGGSPVSTGSGGQSAGASGMAGSTNLGGRSAGSGGVDGLMNAGGRSAAGSSSSGPPTAGTAGHADEGAAGAHEH